MEQKFIVYPLKLIQKGIPKKIFSFACLVLIFLPAFAQRDLSRELPPQFEKYVSQYEQEKLFVHTDKTFYLTGETIWFKVYNIDAGTNKPGDLSKAAYIEILSGDQKPVLQAKIGLRESSGNGSLVITPSISSGNYILRAYTNWMKNCSPDLYYEKIITIVNTLKGADKPIADTSVDYDIQFFPEGGNLVYGLECKVAFRVAGRNGKGVATTGILINQDNDTVVKFQSLLFGLGQFQFTPQQGNQYKALLTTDAGETIMHELPSIYEKGYVMNLSNPDHDHINVSVNTNPLDADQSIYLFVYCRQKVATALMKNFQNGKAEFVIDKAVLEEGVSHLTVFNTLRQPVCERLYFKRPQRLNINLQVNQTEFSTRQKVNLELKCNNQSNQQVNADLSMSVYLIDSLQPEDPNDIASYIWLTSELKGTIESPQYYLNNTGIEADQAIDNLLLTQGWRKFDWEEVLQNKEPSFEFMPEYAGHIISCKITDKKTKLPAKGITVYASIPAKRFKFGSSVSDQTGLLHFDVNNFYGVGDVIIQTYNQKDSLYRIDILNPFSDKYVASRIPAFELSEKSQSNILSRMISAQVQSAYASARAQQFLLPVEDTTAFYGKGDKTYFLDDYTRFATMEEVMREYVKEVLVRKSGGKFHYHVSNAPYKLFFETDPLVLIDGVPVFDINNIIAFNPIKIKRMDILTRKYYYGSLAYNGIISYATYDGDLGGYQLDPGSLLVEYEGLQLQRQFYSPVYETKQQQESRLPDLRNVLLWSPRIQTDNNGRQTVSFYTSDLTGQYVILVQGATSAGLAGSATSRFTVKK